MSPREKGRTMNGKRLAVVAAVTVDEEWWPSVVCCWVRFEVEGDAGRAPNGWVECSCGQARQAGASVSRATLVRIQRFGAPEYDSRDKSIRIWSSKALIFLSHEVSNAFAVNLIRKPDGLIAAAVVVPELLF